MRLLESDMTALEIQVLAWPIRQLNHSILERKNANVTNIDGIFHSGIRCDNCRSAIHRNRHRCMKCSDRNYCQRCLEAANTHSDGHSLLSIPSEGWASDKLTKLSYDNKNGNVANWWSSSNKMLWSLEMTLEFRIGFVAFHGKINLYHVSNLKTH